MYQGDGLGGDVSSRHGQVGGWLDVWEARCVRVMA